MEKMVDLLVNAENVRMLMLMVLGYCGYLKLKSQIRGTEYSLNKRIDSVEASLNRRIDSVEASLLRAMDEKISAFHTHLKANDFAHLNNTIEALTFTLEKNRFLEKEDKEYIDRRLDR